MSRDDEGHEAKEREITDTDGEETIESTVPVNVRPTTDAWPPPNQPTEESEPAPTQQAPGASS